MEKADLEHLIRQTQAGDLVALNTLVEWGEREAFAQALAKEPAGMRVRMEAALDALYRAQRARASRRAGAIKVNKERALQPHVAALAARVANTEIKSTTKLAEALLAFVEREGPSACGLPRLPKPETFRRAIRRK